jgi:flavodoxin I
MKALVIYDSFFGNTEKIARAIGEALGEQMEVEVRRVGDVQPEQLNGLDLVIVGAPTRAFRPSPDISRFLKNISTGSLQGVKAAAFDTRICEEDITSRALRFLVRLFGYAAKPIADKLRKKGADMVIAPEGFCVDDNEGPLKKGELERAAGWAKQIMSMIL